MPTTSDLVAVIVVAVITSAAYAFYFSRTGEVVADEWDRMLAIPQPSAHEPVRKARPVLAVARVLCRISVVPLVGVLLVMALLAYAAGATTSTAVDLAVVLLSFFFGIVGPAYLYAATVFLALTRRFTRRPNRRLREYWGDAHRSVHTRLVAAGWRHTTGNHLVIATAVVTCAALSLGGDPSGPSGGHRPLLFAVAAPSSVVVVLMLILLQSRLTLHPRIARLLMALLAERRRPGDVKLGVQSWRTAEFERASKAAAALRSYISRLSSALVPEHREFVRATGERLCVALRSAALEAGDSQRSRLRSQNLALAGLGVLATKNPVAWAHSVQHLLDGVDVQLPPVRRLARLSTTISATLQVYAPAVRLLGIAVALVLLLSTGELDRAAELVVKEFGG